MPVCAKSWRNRQANKDILMLIWRPCNAIYVPVDDKAKTDQSVNLNHILTCESHRWHTLPVYVWDSKPTYSFPSTVFLHVVRSVKGNDGFGRHGIKIFRSQFKSASSVVEVHSNLRAMQSINTLSRLILCHFTYFYGNVLEHMLWSSAYIHLTTSSVFLKDLATVRITTPSIKALNLHFPIQNYVYSICIMIYVCQWILPSPPSFSLYANGWAPPSEYFRMIFKCEIPITIRAMQITQLPNNNFTSSVYWISWSKSGAYP